MEENAVWQLSHRAVIARYAAAREPELHKLIIRDIIDVQVRDVIMTSAQTIRAANPGSADEVRRQPGPLIRYSEELLKANGELRRFLYQHVYYHPRVTEVNERACEMLRRVFEAYLLDPERLGETATKRIETEGLHRTVCSTLHFWNAAAPRASNRNPRDKLVIPNEERDLTIEAKVTLTERV